MFLWVCVQGAFGAWTVTMKLQPVIVTLHLLFGMTLLALAAWLGGREDHLLHPGPGLAARMHGNCAACARWPGWPAPYCWSSWPWAGG
jgi:heme A synthase